MVDKISIEKTEQKRNFKGEIWAQSSLLENELDIVNDDFEKAWFGKMKELDEQGIPTRRLFVVRNCVKITCNIFDV